MSFDWAGYYQLARELAEQANRDPQNAEAKLRSSISRAYYAAFNLARNHLVEREPDLMLPRGDQTHYFVSTVFEKSSDKVRKDIGEHLVMLRRHRNWADYNTTINNLPGITKQSLSRAQSVIHLLSKLK